MSHDNDDGGRNWQDFEAIRREHDARHKSSGAAPAAPVARRSVAFVLSGRWCWRWLRQRSDLPMLFFRQG